MKPIIQFLLLIVFIGACQEKKSLDNDLSRWQPRPDAALQIVKTTKSYTDFLADYRAKRMQSNQKERISLFYNTLKDSIPAHWSGTPWAFYGMTRVPKQDSIACGYFVTHVLEDLGIRLDTVRLAQAASSVMIDELGKKTHIFKTPEALQSFLLTQLPEDVFIVGLDYHVGLIIKKEKELYFLHSTYLSPGGVILERMMESDALVPSSVFYVSSILQNESLF